MRFSLLEMNSENVQVIDITMNYQLTSSNKSRHERQNFSLDFLTDILHCIIELLAASVHRLVIEAHFHECKLIFM